jgi:hypothetical protein
MKFIKRNCFLLCFLIAFFLMMNGLVHPGNPGKTAGRKGGSESTEEIKLKTQTKIFERLTPEQKKELEKEFGISAFSILGEKPKQKPENLLKEINKAGQKETPIQLKSPSSPASVSDVSKKRASDAYKKMLTPRRLDWTEQLSNFVRLSKFSENEAQKLYSAGNYDACIQNCNDAIVLDPSRPKPYFTKALAHLMKREKGPACAKFEEAIAIEKDKEYKEFKSAINILTEESEKGRINGEDYSYFKHFLWLGKGILTAERGQKLISEESFREAEQAKKEHLLKSVRIENIVFESASPESHEAGSLFREFEKKPRELLNEKWVPAGVNQIIFKDLPDRMLRIRKGVLELNNNTQLQDIRRCLDGSMIDEMATVMDQLVREDAPIAYLGREGLAVSHYSENGNTISFLNLPRENLEKMRNSYLQAQDRISDPLMLRRLIRDRTSGEQITEDQGAGLLRPKEIIDLIQKEVEGKIDKIILRKHEFMSPINFRTVEIIEKLANPQKKTISVRVASPRLFRTLDNTRKPLKISMKESVFLNTLPLDKKAFEQSTFGKSLLERGVKWADYEKGDLKSLRELFVQIEKSGGKVIRRATYNDFQKHLTQSRYLSVTVIGEHPETQGVSDRIEMAGRLVDVKKLEKDIQNIPQLPILDLMICKGQNTLSKIFISNDAPSVFASRGQVDLSHALRRYKKVIREINQGKELDEAYDTAEFETLREILQGKTNASPNLPGIPEDFAKLYWKRKIKELS